MPSSLDLLLLLLLLLLLFGVFNFALDFVFEGKLRASDLPGRDDGAFECQFNILSLKKKALTVNPACVHYHMDNPWP